MKRRFITLPFLLLTLFILPVAASDRGWTEKKLGKTVIKADKAARQEDWSQAIQHGEQAVKGSRALNNQSFARYINQLKNLNRYYDKAGRLHDAFPQVKKAYILSVEHFGPRHETTVVSRTLYYKLLISRKDYLEAIPLVQENISLLGKSRNDHYAHIQFLKQLYSLYKMTGQPEKEEKALLQYLDLDKRIFDSSEKDNLKIIMDLAENYCRQNKIADFTKLMKSYGLKYQC